MRWSVTASHESTAAALLSTRRQLELMRDLQRLANERHDEEQRIRTAFAEGLRMAERERDQTAAEIARQFDKRRAQAATEYEQLTSEARRRYEEERNAAQLEYKSLRHEVEAEVSRITQAARSEQERVSWEALTVFEALKGRPRERFQETVKRLERTNKELAVLEQDAIAIMKLRRQWRDFSLVEPTEGLTKADHVPLSGIVSTGNQADGNGAPDKVEQVIQRATELAAQVREATVALHQQRITRFFEGGVPFLFFAILWVVTAIASGMLLGWQGWQWVVVSGAIAVVATVALVGWLWPRARQQSGQQFRAVQQLLADARQVLRFALEEARERAKREMQALVSERNEQLAAVEQKVRTIVGEHERWKESEIGRAGQTFPQRLAQLREELERSLHEAKQKHAAALAEATEERDRREAENRQRFERRCRELRDQHERDWQAVAERWFSGLSAIGGTLSEMKAECERLFPDWDVADYDNWPRPDESSPAIQFGRVTLDMAKVKHGLPQDERLRPAETAFELPALMTLQEHPVLLVTAEEEGRREAIEVLQLAMLRFLTAMPPGKVRFTILDPVGLGENFASFMHLGDYDEQLIASRIWTDSRQIDEQLTRLTAHMETVLQKYLRNEFATIHEYNAQAGEVAEPFQVLVVANFPVHFGDSSARKLVSIATSGPRCGVYTLMMVDRKQKMPANFDLNDLLAGAVHLDWMPREGLFRWRYPAFEYLPLALDRPPNAERFNEVIRAAGRAAKDSMKVEVPFEQVAPPENVYWTGDCTEELVVPIGRAGARRLQAVRLGKGTSQHLLVCGKTGSGKSTFLHALITNTALHYSPDEVEFYLIDFKKGVEFKTYAAHRLPHARVIAIESEREFGLSVLERLDAELRRRGDMFRAVGVQDLADFRRARPNEAMPRVLLVIDEFQELFVEDDKLAQDAALLLDRLVRQGRAFGIHVLLGSQTLSGAYSLARSTMGQMAVRVALQCSEADANLILSDERNMAARFLSRPGEAIYNDQNGLLAGNSPFQVVWLPEVKRIEYLRRIAARQTEQPMSGREIIVFEGDQPADPADNRQLHTALAAGSSPSGTSISQKAWLGAAVSIKEPTAVTFARHAGSNLLVVGAWEESALGVMTNAIIALAAQNAGQAETVSPQIYVLDSTSPESPEAGTWQRIASALPAKLVEIVSPRETGRIINHLALELARREAAGEESAPPHYLVIFNGGRFRDLRRGEDDFSFSMDRDKPPSPDKQWAEILRNGPTWGIHTLLWCDTYNSVSRLLDRMLLREFEMRVAFQMSAADSSSLLDTPAAAKLRQHRGLLASEDRGTLEKFRPYGIPSAAWLEAVRRTVLQC